MTARRSALSGGSSEAHAHQPVAGAAVQALLFDLGGVIIAIDFNRTFDVWGSYSGVAASVIKSRFSVDSFYAAYECGRIAANEYFVSLRRSLGIRLSDAQFLEGWNALLLDEIPGMAALFARLQPRLPLFVFSNSNPQHQACWAHTLASTLGFFNRVFVSSDLGLRKPEPEAYAAISSAIGVPPGNIMFFDDTHDNIEGARRFGMRTVHVQSITDVERALISAGLA